MSEALATNEQAGTLEQVVIGGDLSRLTSAQRLQYYKMVCESVGLNPYTKPFDYITLSGRLTLYAKRDATDQLRKIHGVSITRLEREVVDGVYTVTAFAKDKHDRTDSALGAVPIEGLRGEHKANAMMKAETKSKRRVTLSICGLGMLDETEVDSIPDAAIVSEPKATPETTVTTAGAPLLSFEDEERSTLVTDATSLGKALKLTAPERAAFKKEYLGDANADIFTVDVAALRSMVDAMRQRAPKEGKS